MPKMAKSRDNSNRTLPYPTVPPTTMAPYTITPSSSAHQNTVSSPPAGASHNSSASWPKDKDELLMRARHQGLNWQPIADRYFPDKSANACRKRHERLMEKRNNADDWDGTKMEALAMAYIDLREEIWRRVAERVGCEKWPVVESKCMEKGLKTLLTIGRTASRRDRNAQVNGLHPGSGAIPDFEERDSLTLSPSRERSRSHPNSDDGFNDSAIGPDGDHSFARPSPQSLHHVPSYSHNNSFPTHSRGHTPPPHQPPSRTFSTSSSSAISSTGFTPIIPTTPLFPSQMTGGGGQTLPSLSSMLGGGMPSISKMASLPVTSMS